MSDSTPRGTPASCACSGAQAGSDPARENPPGATRLRYRVGTHGSFYARMLARLPLETVVRESDGARLRPLAALTTRDPGDPTLALCDAWASVLDVLTFYQERIADEGFLATCTERRSVVELARALGYELAPGVAASTHLAFEIDAAEGAPGRARLDAGLRVVSIPGQDERPQTYETIEAIEARAAWNTLQVRLTGEQPLRRGTERLLLAGAGLRLDPGTTLLAVTDAASVAKGVAAWAWSRAHAVTEDHASRQTAVALEAPFGTRLAPQVPAATLGEPLFGVMPTTVLALRKRASIFGNNAPDWRAQPDSVRRAYLGIGEEDLVHADERHEWPGFRIFAPGAELDAPIVRHVPVEPTVESVARAAVESARKSAEGQRGATLNAAQGALREALSGVVGVVQQVTQAFASVAATFFDSITLPESALPGSPGFDPLGVGNAANQAQIFLGEAFETIRGVLNSILPTLPDDDAQEGGLSFLGIGFDTSGWNKLLERIDQLADFLREVKPKLGEIDQSTFLDELTTPLNNLLGSLQDAIFNAPFFQPLIALSSLDLGWIAQTLEEAQGAVGRTVALAQRGLAQGVAAAGATALAETLEAVAEKVVEVAQSPEVVELNATLGVSGGRPLLTPELMGRIARVTVKAATIAGALNPGVLIADAVGQAASTFQVDDEQAPWIAELVGVLSGSPADLGVDDQAVAENPEVFESLVYLLQPVLQALPPSLQEELRSEREDEAWDPEAVLALALVVGGLGAAGVTVASGIPLAVAPLFTTYGAAFAAAALPVILPLLGAAALGVTLAGPQHLSGAREVKRSVVEAVERALHPPPHELPPRRALAQLASRSIDLDAVYDKVTPGSWVLLVAPDLASPGAAPLVGAYRVLARDDVSRSDYTLSGKVSRLTLEEHGRPLEAFAKRVRDTSVFLESGALALDRVRLDDPVGGHALAWEQPVEGLAEGRTLLVTGVRATDGVAAGEVVRVAAVEGASGVELERELSPYVRASVKVYGNVVAATHGEAREEVLGSGDAATPHPSFTLAKTPLTYVSADTPSGRSSTLEVRVGGVRWERREHLLDAHPAERVYQVRHGEDGATTIRFGDGARGARLPSGAENVQAAYRVGIGREGRVAAGQLRVLKTRPLGVRGVVNPLAAEGGEAPESMEDARRNAPTRALTLDRVVSLRDYESFARAFAGVAKARANALLAGRRHVVHLTLAGPEGEALGPGAVVLERLREALERARDRAVGLDLSSYRPRPFDVAARLAVDIERRADDVLAAARAALASAFGFERRDFAVPLSSAEVLVVLRNVPGVRYVDLERLALDQAEGSDPVPSVLPCRPASWSRALERIEPAELLLPRIVALEAIP